MALEYTEIIKERSPFIKLLGVEVLKLENGNCQLSLKIKENFLNVHKNVHGGVIYSMADISMGVAVYSTIKKDEEAATIEIKINYLKPSKGKKLLCDANIIQKGKNIAVLEAEIKEDEKIVAKAIGTFSIFKQKVIK
ncbi:MAG: thioesterase [Deltaproteobacteria bacterium HGW-Deltaproteobacteria-7]|jgi:acyl-CoA thioesterase|nr:MAG: thioesterase [Deltaproteobacteria bacterium HGW-Deltaproteobacteria-7]PKN20685.1 MAG: thioesterase [Deltaproteobacteria bacterium HGW-Deltaproteobacteria-6]